MKTIPTVEGKFYCVATSTSCDVTTEAGTLLGTAEAGQPLWFQAQKGNTTTLSDDNAEYSASRFNSAPQQQLAGIGVLGGNNSLPAGYTRLAYLMPEGDASRLNSEIKAFSDTGCRVRAFWDSSRASLFPEAWFMLMADTLYWGPLVYWLPKTALGYRQANGAYYPQKAGLPDASRGNNVTAGYPLNGEFQVHYNWRWDMKWKLTDEDNSLERSLTAVGQFQYAENIIIFGRRSDIPGGWAGGVRELLFSRGTDVVSHLVPVLTDEGQPTMWDLIRKIELKKYTAGDFIAGIDTQAQFNNMLRKLPDRSGQEVGTLQVRLAEALQTEANLAALDAMVAKNWEISQAA